MHVKEEKCRALLTCIVYYPFWTDHDSSLSGPHLRDVEFIQYERRPPEQRELLQPATGKRMKANPHPRSGPPRRHERRTWRWSSNKLLFSAVSGISHFPPGKPQVVQVFYSDRSHKKGSSGVAAPLAHVRNKVRWRATHTHPHMS
jgi:hypothetical protein